MLPGHVLEGSAVMTGRDPLNIVGQTVAEKYVVEKLVGEGGFACPLCLERKSWCS